MGITIRTMRHMMALNRGRRLAFASLSDIGLDDILSKSQKNALCAIIDCYGTGEHPTMTLKTVPYVTVQYARRMVKRARFLAEQEDLNPTQQKLLQALEYFFGLQYRRNRHVS